MHLKDELMSERRKALLRFESGVLAETEIRKYEASYSVGDSFFGYKRLVNQLPGSGASVGMQPVSNFLDHMMAVTGQWIWERLLDERLRRRWYRWRWSLARTGVTLSKEVN
jgi:hypothetical protein